MDRFTPHPYFQEGLRFRVQCLGLKVRDRGEYGDRDQSRGRGGEMEMGVEIESSYLYLHLYLRTSLPHVSIPGPKTFQNNVEMLES